MADNADERKLWPFVALWTGEVVSIFGSGLTGFSLGIWIYQNTGSITQYTIIGLLLTLPGILLSPLIGVIVDRVDRRLLMIMSNVVSALCTVVIAFLFQMGWLGLWQICVIMTILSVSSTALMPAYSASVSLLVPKRHLGRASGMMQSGQAAAQILSPPLAGLLVITIGVPGILLIDFCTYIVAIATLLMIRIPRPEPSSEPELKRGSMLSEAKAGWKYLTSRPGLFSIILFITVTNFASAMAGILITPLVLSFTNPAVFGTVSSATGIGLLVGGLFMSFWGGPKRRVNGVFIYGFVLALALALEGLRPNALLVAIAIFISTFISPIVNGCVVPIIQTKTAPEVQGRIFASVRLLGWCAVPLAYLLAGPLADNIFNPMLVEGGFLADSVGLIIGTGPGRGIGLMFVGLGFIAFLATLWAYFNPRIKLVEDELPDAVAEESAYAVQNV